MSGAGAPDLRATLELAVQHHQAGRFDDATVLYRQVLAHQPRHADSLHLLGVIADQKGQHDLAIGMIREAIAINPNEAVYYYNLGIALTEHGQPEQAVSCYRDAILLNPDYAEALNNLGLALRGLGQLDEAIIRHRRAIELRPSDAKAYNNLGIALRERGQLDDAVASYRHSLALQPNYPDALNNLGVGLKDQGRLTEAILCCRQAVALRPDFAETHYNLGITLLTAGELPEGWREFEWRWKTTQLVGAERCFPQPQWYGEDAHGKTLLIHAEQGYGDALQFCRYATLAASRGLRVFLEVQPPLVRLMKTLVGVEHVVATGQALPAFDLHCPMMSLPLAFGTDLASIPSAGAYLSPDQQQVAAWRQRLAALGHNGRRIGLVWAGNPRLTMPAAAAVDRRRSMPPAHLAPLFDITGLEFFSLQKDGPSAGNVPLIDLMPEMDDFADTAALIANLDLVIAVDTAVAHLAAALGKPVWLLERFDSCWRWLRGRRDTPWYPAMHLYRQPKAGDWASVITQVAFDLNHQAWRAQRGHTHQRPSVARRDSSSAESAMA
jgi:Flp pilus assembly protein TadD